MGVARIYEPLVEKLKALFLFIFYGTPPGCGYEMLNYQARTRTCLAFGHPRSGWSMEAVSGKLQAECWNQLPVS